MKFGSQPMQFLFTLLCHSNNTSLTAHQIKKELNLNVEMKEREKHRDFQIE